MQFSTSVLFYFIATAGVAAGETSTSTIKDDVGDGGENKMSFSLSYANNDGSTCAPCLLCEGSALHDVLDPNIASMCISCTDDASCDEAIITNSFQKAWSMTYVSLTSQEGDATFDPETISILASDDYDEGSKTGIWSALATSSSALVFQQRNMSQDIVFDNSALHSHYRFVFRRKDNVNTMKIGHVGVVESYLKTYAAELFNKIMKNEVIGLPTKAPTTAPTTAPTNVPTNVPTGSPYTFSITAPFTLTRNNLIETIPEDDYPEQFILTFKIYPQGTIGSWTSIVRFTSTTNDCCNYGDRWLAFFFTPNTYTLQVRIVNTANEYVGYLSGVVGYKWNDIKIEAIGDIVNIYINGVLKGSATNKNRPARELRVYASDTHLGPANAKISDFDLTNIR